MTDDITRLVRFTSKGLDEVLQAKNQGLKGEITHIGRRHRPLQPRRHGSGLA